MSVTSSSNKIIYTSTGGTVFAYNFPVIDEDHLEVYKNGVLQTSGYTVTGVGSALGGNVTFAVAVTTGVQVMLKRIVPLTQTIVIPGGLAKFPAESTEDGLDLGVMRDIQMQEELDRALKFPSTTEAASIELPDPEDEDNWGQALIIEVDGSGIGVHPIDDEGDVTVMTTTGDMLIHTASSVARLPHGNASEILNIDYLTQLPTWVPPAVLTADAYGIPSDGGNDTVSALQVLADRLAADGGGTLQLHAGGLYTFTESLILGSNTVLDMNGATIQAYPDPGFLGTNALNNCYLIRNENHGHNNIPGPVTELTDENIVVMNGHFDYNDVIVAGGGGHAIAMRYVTHPWVLNCTFAEGENATAFRACLGALTDNCHALNPTNAGFDHWDGASDFVVRNSTVTGDGSVDMLAGIQATGTDGKVCGPGLFIGNTVRGIRDSTNHFGSGIAINTSPHGELCEYITSSDNHIEDCDLGIVMSGAGGYHSSINDTIVDVDYEPIFIQYTGSAPSYCRIINPRLVDCDVDAGGNGIIIMSGTQNSVEGVQVVNTGAVPYPYIVWVASTGVDCRVDVREVLAADAGTSGRHLDQGTRTRIYGDSVAWTPTMVFGAGGGSAVTYTSRACFYTRNGVMVHITGAIVVNSNGTDTGSVTITLPITSAAVACAGVINFWTIGTSGLTSPLVGLIGSAANVMTVYDAGATGHTVLAGETNIPDAASLYFSGVYRSAL